VVGAFVVTSSAIFSQTCSEGEKLSSGLGLRIQWLGTCVSVNLCSTQ